MAMATASSLVTVTEREIRSSGLKASVWKHFGFYDQENGKGIDKTYSICKACKAKIKYSGNTTNMRQHLTRFHPGLERERNPPVVAANQRTIEEGLSKLPRSSERAKRISSSIATFIAKDLRPYAVVNNEGFRALMRTLEPRYKLPKRKYFAQKAVPELYGMTKTEVLESLKKACRVALTCDAWTSVATQSYVTVTAHFVSEGRNGWELVSYVLQTRVMTDSHTGANVAELLQKVAEEWQITDKDLVLVTDNASNMIVAAQLGNFLHIKCYAHTLNLASQKALKLPTVTRLLGRIRRITTFFHRSTTANQLLKENQNMLSLKNHKLKTDVCTRWNSAYEMVQRFLEQQPAICATLLSPQVRKKDSDIATLTEADITNAEDLIAALKPMKDATTLISQEKTPTVCLIAPVHAKLIQNTRPCAEDSPLVREIKQAISEDLSKRYSIEQERNTLHTASALDPRFKALAFLSEKEREDTYGRVIAEAAALEVKIFNFL